MKTATLLLLVIAIFFFGNTKAQSADQELQQKAWSFYMTPGEMHKKLAHDSGSWDEEITMWMAPGAKPQTNKATCENHMILGDRYQQSMHSGNMDGMPFEGIGTTGYDNSLKKFVSTWIDNMGSGIMVCEGTFDSKTNTINFTGKTVDPVTQKYVPFRETFTFIDDNNSLMEMFMLANGKEYKSMSIKLTRRH